MPVFLKLFQKTKKMEYFQTHFTRPVLSDTKVRERLYKETID